MTVEAEIIGYIKEKKTTIPNEILLHLISLGNTSTKQAINNFVNNYINDNDDIIRHNGPGLKSKIEYIGQDSQNEVSTQCNEIENFNKMSVYSAVLMYLSDQDKPISIKEIIEHIYSIEDDLVGTNVKVLENKIRGVLRKLVVANLAVYALIKIKTNSLYKSNYVAYYVLINNKHLLPNTEKPISSYIPTEKVRKKILDLLNVHDELSYKEFQDEIPCSVLQLRNALDYLSKNNYISELVKYNKYSNLDKQLTTIILSLLPHQATQKSNYMTLTTIMSKIPDYFKKKRVKNILQQLLNDDVIGGVYLYLNSDTRSMYFLKHNNNIVEPHTIIIEGNVYKCIRESTELDKKYYEVFNIV